MSLYGTINTRVEAGLATIVKSGAGAFTWTDKRFDPMTGAEVESVVTQVLLTDINSELDTLRNVDKPAVLASIDDRVNLKNYLLSL